MGKRLNLLLKGSVVDFDVRRVVAAGYTGRDQAQVRAHIAELEREGIPAPDAVPAIYPLDASCATVESDVQVTSAQVSGEAEPALLFRGETLDDALVSVISDFTDREEERISIPRSKIQPKPFSPIVWEYANLTTVWDQISLRSWVGSPANRELYQSGKLGQLLAPKDLLARLNIGSLKGTVLLMGTVPLLSGKFSFSDYFACELETPSGDKLACAFNIRRVGSNATRGGSSHSQ